MQKLTSIKEGTSLWVLTNILILVCYVVISLHKVGFTHDSTYYLSAAQSFAEKGVLLNPDGSSFNNIWPPLFPVVLALFSPFILELWPYVQISLTLLVLNGWAFWAKRHLSQQAPHLFFLAGLSFSVPFLVNVHFLWSEVLFLAFFSGWFFIYSSEKLHPGLYLLMFFLGVGLTLTRSTGFYLAGSFMLSLWIFSAEKRKSLWPTAISFLSFFPFFYWLLVVKGKGEASYSLKALAVNFSDYFGILAKWFFPLPDHFISGIIFSLVYGVFSFWFLRKEIPAMKAIFLACTLYLFATILITSTPEIGMKADIERYLSVIYAPFMLCVIVAGRQLPKKWQWSLGSIWILYIAARFFKNVIFYLCESGC